MTREIDLAWAAGFFDGEGSIGVYWRKAERYYRGGFWILRLSLTQVKQEVLQDFHSIVVLGSTSKKVSTNPKHRDKWIWASAARSGGRVLELMLPYLRGKKQEAEVALQFRSTFDPNCDCSKTSEEIHCQRRDFANLLKSLK